MRNRISGSDSGYEEAHMLCGAGGVWAKAPRGGMEEEEEELRPTLGGEEMEQMSREEEGKEVLTQVLQGGRRGQDQGDSRV